MLSAEAILTELRKSDRWGVNTQPEDVDAFAQGLSQLPCVEVVMKRRDLLRVVFERRLTSEERAALNAIDSGVDALDLVDGRGKTSAELWWD